MGEQEIHFAIVLTTVGSEAQANQISNELVEQRLAACVSVIPQVVSTYRWKGKVCRDEELLLVVKTAVHLCPAVRSAIRQLHSYELPEILLLPVRGADPDLLRWLEASVRPEEREAPPEPAGGPAEDAPR